MWKKKKSNILVIMEIASMIKFKMKNLRNSQIINFKKKNILKVLTHDIIINNLIEQINNI